jgi:hypothetical protein
VSAARHPLELYGFDRLAFADAYLVARLGHWSTSSRHSIEPSTRSGRSAARNRPET